MNPMWAHWRRSLETSEHVRVVGFTTEGAIVLLRQGNKTSLHVAKLEDLYEIVV